MGRVPDINDWRNPKGTFSMLLKWKESRTSCNYQFLAIRFPSQNLGAEQTLCMPIGSQSMILK